MKKYLGIDFGDSYIGLAFADDSALALPFRVVKNDSTLFPFLQKIVTDEHITECVVGWPISMSGKENERTRLTTTFMTRLEQKLSIPIHRMDERLSSQAAARMDSKKRVDASAAAEILQAYLDVHAHAERTI